MLPAPRPPPPPCLVDLVTAVLFQWGDLPRLAALVRLLHAAVTARPGSASDETCDTR